MMFYSHMMPILNEVCLANRSNTNLNPKSFFSLILELKTVPVEVGWVVLSVNFSFYPKYLVSSQEKLFNPSIPSLGLRNVIYINETHTR